MSKKLFFNWKMNPTTSSQATELFEEVVKSSESLPVHIVVCPPFVYLPLICELSKKTNIKIGSQDISTQDSGSLTGEISGSMLVDLGCQYSIIGHSETREINHLSNQDVNQKIKHCLQSNLTPIFCIGYQADKTAKDINYTELSEQIRQGLQDIKLDNDQTIYLAYEPVWAIGTGKTASNSIIAEVTKFILEELKILGLDSKVEILYGGSVDDQSITELIKIEQVSGFLIGGASLKPEKFSRIIEIVSDK